MNSQKTSAARLDFITRYRGFLITLIILIHVGITYGAAGEWYFTEQNNVEWLKIGATLIGSLSQSFVLGAFFFLSAYFLPGTLSRKGAGRLLLDKALRLGIPFAVYYVLINSFNIWIIQRLGKGLPVRFAIWPGSGPLWFAQVLFIFTLLYVAAALIFRGQAGKGEAKIPAAGNADLSAQPASLPKPAAVIIYIFLAGAAGFAARLWYPIGRNFSNLQFGFFPMYITLFCIGLKAGKDGWLTQFKKVRPRAWLIPSVVFIILQPVILIGGGALENTDPIMGGLHWQNAAYALWEAACGTCLFILTITAFARRDERLSAKPRPGLSAAGLSYGDASMGVFLFHAPVIILVALLMLKLNIHPGIKYLLLAAVGTLIPWGLTLGLRKIPGVRKVL